MLTFTGDSPNRTHGSGMHSLFNASPRNITKKDFNTDRQTKSILAVKEAVLADNFIDHKPDGVVCNSYVPSVVKVPEELRGQHTSNPLSPNYVGDDSQVSKFQTWQDKLSNLWDKPVVRITTGFVIGLAGIAGASHLIRKTMAQKIGSKAQNFNQIKEMLDKQISENLDDVAKSLDDIAEKLLKAANQDTGGNTKRYQQLIDFSLSFKEAAAKTKSGKMPENIEMLFAGLKGHLNKFFGEAELAKLSPELRKIAEQYKNSQQLPPFARNININDDVNATIINAIQDPTNVKNIQALFAVLGITAVGATAKRFVDGLTDIWIRQKEADIERDLQESMISIETKAFSGKNHIVRNMIATNAKDLKQFAQENSWRENYQILKGFMANQNKVKAAALSFGGGSEIFDKFNQFAHSTQITETFKGDINKNNDDKTKTGKKTLYTLLTLGGVLTAAVLFLVLKNIAKTVQAAEVLKKDVAKRTQFFSEDVINIMKKDAPFGLQDAVFGNPTKIGLASYVEGVTGFLYTYIMNKSPETLLAFLAIVGATGGGYVGTKMLDAVKDVEVKRVNAETERRLQDRLVEVELKNFIAKKNSLIQPLVSEYKQMVRANTPNQDLNRQYNMILDEIKNGPPFIYA